MKKGEREGGREGGREGNRGRERGGKGRWEESKEGGRKEDNEDKGYTSQPLKKNYPCVLFVVLSCNSDIFPGNIHVNGCRFHVVLYPVDYVALQGKAHSMSSESCLCFAECVSFTCSSTSRAKS